jgi:hypothetical protein
MRTPLMSEVLAIALTGAAWSQQATQWHDHGDRSVPSRDPEARGKWQEAASGSNSFHRVDATGTRCETSPATAGSHRTDFPGRGDRLT